MKEFVIGQRVVIVDNEGAAEICLNQHTIENEIGRVFTVTCLHEVTGAALVNGWAVLPELCDLVQATDWELVDSPARKTTFQAVAEMNEAFNNPKGDPENIDMFRIIAQFSNIHDEYMEGLAALGLPDWAISAMLSTHAIYVKPDHFMTDSSNIPKLRDAIADIKVFADGASHLMGFDGDADMHTVVSALMTRFIKDDDDKAATIAKHAGKGVTDVYFEGEYPKMIMKSAVAQPDAPVGKFLKSASYSEPVFV
jgi:hypothetical protein